MTLNNHVKEGFFGPEEVCIHTGSHTECFGKPEKISVNFVCGSCREGFEAGHSHPVSERRNFIGVYRWSDNIPEHIDVVIAQMVAGLMFDTAFGEFI